MGMVRPKVAAGIYFEGGIAMSIMYSGGHVQSLKHGIKVEPDIVGLEPGLFVRVGTKGFL